MSEIAIGSSGGDAAARPTARLRVLETVFVVSGFCGLIYESIWSHYLKLFVGHAAYAQTVVLVVFIGGMAAGAAIAGRFTGRIASPLWAYAAIEALIGVASLGFHRVFETTTEWAYAWLLPAACSAESVCFTQWAVAGALILPQSVLLGATFPLMTAGVLRLAPQHPGRQIGLFYFLNSIGAVAGVLCASFVLIPAVGLPGTLLTAALFNIAVAITAYFAGKGAGSPALLARSAEHGPADAPRADDVQLLLLVAALTGLASFVYEIVWIRMLALVVGSSTHAFELMLAAFILGLALGGAWIRSRIDRMQNLFAALAIVQVLMGALAVATLPLYDRMFDLLGWILQSVNRSDGGYLLYNGATQAIALAVMLPATFLAGMTLPLITTALLRGRLGEGSIGYVYAANTVGAIVGVILTVHLLMPWLGARNALLTGAAIDIALGVWILAARLEGARRRTVAAWAAGAAAVVMAVAIAPSTPVERTASGVFRSGSARLQAGSEILHYRDGKTATVAVTREGDSLSIRTNGKPDAAIAQGSAPPTEDEYTMALLAVLPLAHKPDARSAAVIGFGSGMSTATLLASPALERVDTIEIEPQMVEGARHFGALVEPAFTDPRSRIVIDDAKSYFARGRVRYDVITSEPSNPWVSGVASLFTIEFYRRIKHYLNAGGVFAQWLHTYEITDELVATVLRAIDAEFGDYAVYMGNNGDVVVVAARDRLPERLSGEPLAWPKLSATLARLRLDTLDELEARRIAGRATIQALLRTQGPAVNSDFHPLLEYEAPRARFLRANAGAIERLSIAPMPVVEMLEQRAGVPMALSPEAHPGSKRAALLAAPRVAKWLTDGPDTTAPAGAPSILFDQAAILRATLWHCAPPPAGADLVDSLLAIAGELNPHLAADAAGRLWAAIEAAPCLARQSPAVRRWIPLFAAAGARAPDAMVAGGRALLDTGSALPIGQREYAMLATATGLLAQGRRQDAREVLDLHLGALAATRQRLPWILALRGYAAEPQAATRISTNPVPAVPATAAAVVPRH